MTSALAIINLIPFLLTILMLIPVFKNTLKNEGMAWFTAGTMAVLFFWLLSFLPQVEEEPLEYVIEWVPQLGLTLSWYLDGLSLMFALVVTGVGIAVFLYAGHYFDDDKDEAARFYSYLATFAGAMLALVLSGNLIMLFIAWELTSITSFLLIGFKGSKDEAARAGASRALVITGGGGLALFVGMVLLGWAAGSFEWHDILKMKTMQDHAWYTGITILVMIGAFTKSAQFPFHFWLPGGMSAPSPASAYLHSATMVKAGVYLLYRLYPTLGNTALWQGGLLAIGLTTMLLGALFAIRKRDLKALLAYTTISKLGSMIALIGLPDYAGLKAAAVGIIAHALYKGTFFLLAGTVEHATGTRNLDNLGGLRKYMPGVTVIAVLVGLSMAGYPPLLGFVAKETLLDAMVLDSLGDLPIVITFIASLLMVLSAGLLVIDVYFTKPDKKYDHFHRPSLGLVIGPGLLAVMSLLTALLLNNTVIPIIEPAVPKEFTLYLFPDHISTPVILSIAILIIGPVLYAAKFLWLRMPWFIMPTGEAIYARIIRFVEAFADRLLTSQGGKLRYYLLAIMSVVAVLMLFGGFDNLRALNLEFNNFSTDIMKIMMLVLTIGATFASIILRQHLLAALAMGVSGYSVGALFLLEPAPDVALVQFLVETLASVLIILMLARVSIKQREEVMAVLWKGRRDNNRLSLMRDIAISTVIGVSVGLFALGAVNDRKVRLTNYKPVANWHIDNAYEETQVTDVVSAILADFRGTDTMLEITVFSMAALGVLTLLTIPQGRELLSLRRVTQVMREVTVDEGTEMPENTESMTMDEYGAFGDAHDVPRLATPITRVVATLVLPFAILISLSHVLYGGSGPGDGFTAGVVSGLAVALWYVVFGYFEARLRLRWLQPGRLIAVGLFIAVLNALLGMVFGEGFLNIYMLGDGRGPAGLHLVSPVIFEFAIFLTVFGGVTAIMEAIAHPDEVEVSL